MKHMNTRTGDITEFSADIQKCIDILSKDPAYKEALEYLIYKLRNEK